MTGTYSVLVLSRFLPPSHFYYLCPYFLSLTIVLRPGAKYVACSSLPSPLWFVPCIFLSREDLSPFLPRRLRLPTYPRWPSAVDHACCKVSIPTININTNYSVWILILRTRHLVLYDDLIKWDAIIRDMSYLWSTKGTIEFYMIDCSQTLWYRNQANRTLSCATSRVYFWAAAKDRYTLSVWGQKQANSKIKSKTHTTNPAIGPESIVYLIFWWV